MSTPLHIDPPTLLASSAQMSWLERRLLLDVLESLPDRATIVEIGTADAGTSRLIAAAGAERGFDVSTVDVVGNSSQREALQALGVRPLRGDSPEVAGRWPSDRPIDLLLIDGDHSYLGVRNDWEAWTPHLAPTAWVLMHDVSPLCPGEFVWFWNRVFRGEIDGLVGCDTLHGGRWCRRVANRALDPRAGKILRHLLESGIAAWPEELLALPAPSSRHFGIRQLEANAAADAALWALELVPLASAKHALLADDDVGGRRDLLDLLDSEHVSGSETLVRNAWLSRRFAEDPASFAELCFAELAPTIADFIAEMPAHTLRALERGGVLGRTTLFDFCDPLRVAAARSNGPCESSYSRAALAFSAR